jgi:hypothetical protein
METVKDLVCGMEINKENPQALSITKEEFIIFVP